MMGIEGEDDVLGHPNSVNAIFERQSHGCEQSGDQGNITLHS